jgi:SAM-dependent methyltransferase
MPVIRVDNYVDAYRSRSQSKDLHELAARPDKKAVTEFVNQRILELLQPSADDLVVDIGCGDGALLRMISGDIKSVGIVSTVEEQRRLECVYPSLSIKAGDMRAIPIDSGVASRIVCNAVLFYLQSESEVRAALREIKRIARPNAIVLLGEIPEIDEYSYYGIYRGQSMLGFLRHVLRRNGLRAFLGMIRRWSKAIFGQEQILLNSAGIFYAPPEKMVKIAEGCGLVLKTYFRHKDLDEQGNVTDSPFRYDYLFTV